MASFSVSLLSKTAKVKFKENGTQICSYSLVFRIKNLTEILLENIISKVSNDKSAKNEEIIHKNEYIHPRKSFHHHPSPSLSLSLQEFHTNMLRSVNAVGLFIKRRKLHVCVRTAPAALRRKQSGRIC